MWHLTEQEQSSGSRQMQCHFETQAGKTAGRNSFKMPTPLLCSWQDNPLLIFAFQFFLFSLHKLSFLLFFKVGSSLRKDFLKLTYKVMGFIMKCPRTLFDFPPLVGSLSYSRTTLPPFKSRVLYCPFFSSSSLRSRFLLSWYPF